jgi:hypothetical protein
LAVTLEIKGSHRRREGGCVGRGMAAPGCVKRATLIRWIDAGTS